MIKYLGSKRLLIPAIVAAVKAFPNAQRVLDLFSGTSRVGYALKAEGFHVTANDQLHFASTIARCYVEADASKVELQARNIIHELSKVEPKGDWFTEIFCERSRFFQRENGARIEAIRNRIAELELDPVLESIALISLMEAADRVDSTTGVQMAYLKSWAPRSYQPLELRIPPILKGEGKALLLDAKDAVHQVEADIAYLDPPYNQHRYVGNYHVWETLVRWDKPHVEGVACKRIDAKEVKSDFNSRVRIASAFEYIVEHIQAPCLLISFSDESFLARKTIEQILSTRGHVAVATFDFPRYVGARIGIFNKHGTKVGRVSHVRNQEMLFCVAENRSLAENAAHAAQKAIDLTKVTQPVVLVPVVEEV